MKRKSIGLRNCIAAVLTLALAVCAWAVSARVRPVYAAAPYTLVYDGDGKTVVTDIRVADPDTPFVLTLPAEVETVEIGAFAGAQITEIIFEPNSRLKTIGDFAFGDTKLTQIALPEGLVSIGASAFASNDRLHFVSLPQSLASIGVGAFVNCAKSDTLCVTVKNADMQVADGAFDSRVCLVADTFAAAQALQDKADFAAYTSQISYPVTVRFRDQTTEEILDSAVRLKGQNFNVVRVDGVWKTNAAITAVGTPRLGYIGQWYDTKDGQTPLTPETLNAKLAACAGDTLDLYGTTNEGQAFIARTDLVYDGTKYTAANINAVLAPNSKKVTAETVTIRKNNAAVTEICNAGTYSVTIDDNQPIEVTIAKAQIDLTDLDTYVFRVNGLPLLDRTVYVADDGKASLTQPSSGSYQAKNVLDSVVRKGIDTVYTMTLDIEGVKLTQSETNTASGVGVVTTTFGLFADDNHILVGDNEILSVRSYGLTVTHLYNFQVEKTWYLVDMDNWFVDLNDNDYTIADRTYGSEAALEARVMYGNATAEITYALTYAGQTRNFEASAWEKYFNETMPVGQYTLKMSVGATTEGDKTFAAFDSTVTFRITPASLSASAVASVKNALDGKFDRIVGASETIAANTDAANAVRSALGVAAVRPHVAVEENVWDDPAYYGTAHIEVNLASALNNEYGAYADKESAGVYPYRYRIVADNYATVETDDMRFTVAEYAVVPVPEIAAKPYNGALQTANVAGNDLYTVVNNGGTNVGDYPVTLTLLNPECHLWAGQTIGDGNDPTKTLTFTVTRAQNSWVVDPTMQNWVKGRFDAAENVVSGNALFGFDGMHYIVTDTSEKNILFDSRTDTSDRLAELKTGDYYVKVVIDATENYTGIEHGSLFHVFKKPGLPWWGTLLITLGALLLAAAILFVLWKKGVFQILTGKIVLAIRTRASVDATIASVRAAKKMEEGRRSVEEANRRERAEERKAQAAAERAKPAEERAAALEQKAEAAAERAERMRARSEAMRKRAERMRGQTQESVAEQEAAATADETPEE